MDQCHFHFLLQPLLSHLSPHPFLTGITSTRYEVDYLFPEGSLETGKSTRLEKQGGNNLSNVRGAAVAASRSNL